MGFWAGALTVVALTAVAAVLLYAFAVWESTKDEPYWVTVWNVVKQIATGDFWT